MRFHVGNKVKSTTTNTVGVIEGIYGDMYWVNFDYFCCWQYDYQLEGA